MPREYGTTNAAPYAAAPAIGAVGDTYWNTTAKALYASDGAAWNLVGPSAAGTQYWSDTGSALTPVTATRDLSLPGDPSSDSLLVLGAQIWKQRLQTLGVPAGPNLWLGANWNALTSTQDDVNSASWLLAMRYNPAPGPQDSFTVARAPAGGALATLLTLTSAGQAYFNVNVNQPTDVIRWGTSTGTATKGIALANVRKAEIRGVKVTGVDGPLVSTHNVTGKGLDGAATIDGPKLPEPVAAPGEPYKLR